MDQTRPAVLYAKKINKDTEVVLSYVSDLPTGIPFIILSMAATEADKNMVIAALEFAKAK